jgi:hypothetical protein
MIAFIPLFTAINSLKSIEDTPRSATNTKFVHFRQLLATLLKGIPNDTDSISSCISLSLIWSQIRAMLSLPVQIACIIGLLDDVLSIVGSLRVREKRKRRGGGEVHKYTCCFCRRVAECRVSSRVLRCV